MNEVERKLKEKEVETLIQEINESAQDLYSKAKISLEDRQEMNSCIDNIRNADLEDDDELEEATSEAYGMMFLLSTKAMYSNVSDLNRAFGKDLSETLRDKIQEMELTLFNVIKSLEDRDEELYNSNIDKITDISEKFEAIKAEIGKEQ